MARGLGGLGRSGDAETCPCGVGVYASCCTPQIEAGQRAITAEQLMRSRYNAFARASRCPQAIDHLLRTHPVPGSDPRQRRRNLQATTSAVQWLGLNVLAIEAGGPYDVTCASPTAIAVPRAVRRCRRMPRRRRC